jgi:hypothetical protein
VSPGAEGCIDDTSPKETAPTRGSRSRDRSPSTAVQGLVPPSDHIRAEPSYRFKYLPARAQQKTAQLLGNAGAARGPEPVNTLRIRGRNVR